MNTTSELLRCSRIYFDYQAAKKNARQWTKMGFFGVTCRKAIDNMWVVRGKAPIEKFAEWMARHSDHWSDGGKAK